MVVQASTCGALAMLPLEKCIFTPLHPLQDLDQFCLRGESGGWGWDPSLRVSCSIHENPIKLST